MMVFSEKPLVVEESLTLCVVPPGALEPPLSNVVQVLHLDWATGACPRGYYIMHLSQAASASTMATSSLENDDPFGELKRVLVALLSHCPEGIGERDVFLRCCYEQAPRDPGARWDSAGPGGEALDACAANGSLAVCADPAAVPQFLVGQETEEARRVFLAAPLYEEAPVAADFLKKPQHLAMEEEMSKNEDLEHFNQQMQEAADSEVAAAAASLEAHRVDGEAAAEVSEAPAEASEAATQAPGGTGER